MIRPAAAPGHRKTMTATSYWPADRSSPVLDTTVGGVLRAAAGQAPDRVALIAGDRQWTYAQLNQEVERVARARLQH